jgi:hypothetical protein
MTFGILQPTLEHKRYVGARKNGFWRGAGNTRRFAAAFDKAATASSPSQKTWERPTVISAHLSAGHKTAPPF